VGQRSVRYSPGERHLHESVGTTSIEQQLDAVDRWLGFLAVQVEAIGADRPWWRSWPFLVRP
jgi:hypothetical protein